MKLVILCNVNDHNFLSDKVAEMGSIEEIVYSDDIYSKLPSRLKLDGIKHTKFKTEWDDLSYPDAIIKEGKYGKYDAKAAWRKNIRMINYSDKVLAVWDGTDERIKSFIEKAKKENKEVVEIVHPDYQNNFEYTLYVDLDGVLSDFTKGVSKLIGKEFSATDYREMWAAIRECRMRGELFFYGLELMPDAQELWNTIKKFNPIILTSTGGIQHRYTSLQKELWVCNNLGHNVVVITTRSSKMKSLYANEKSILIDDREKSIKPWVEAGGIGILHTNAKDTIAELKKYGI